MAFQVTYMGAFTDYLKCPSPHLPEFAFIGRSNVGKSSLVNVLMGRKKLARVSAEPGKTRLIHHYLIENKWYLVDLPGYGYARVSKESRGNWARFVAEYLLFRSNLVCLFVLLDIRHSLQKIDREVLEWLHNHEVSFVLVFTKADKLSGNQRARSLASLKRELAGEWEETPPFFLASSVTGEGKEDILAFISRHSRAWKENVNGE